MYLYEVFVLFPGISDEYLVMTQFACIKDSLVFLSLLFLLLRMSVNESGFLDGLFIFSTKKKQPPQIESGVEIGLIASCSG